jgi:hypothetical protein
MAVTDLDSAVVAFRQFAVASFNAALAQAQATEPSPDPKWDEKTKAREHANWEAKITKARADMASALQQLVQADVMLSELKGRDSYRTLVGLIATATNTLNSLIAGPGGMTVQERTQLITAHAALLDSLADIIPLALWRKDEPNTTSG